MKIITYNVNGIRAAIQKGLIAWLTATDADMLCFQEIKVDSQKFPYVLFENLGYECYVFPAQKAGYSGVAILSKKSAHCIMKGFEMVHYDHEGRIIRAVFEHFTLVSVYVPSGASSPERQAFKVAFLHDFYAWIEEKKDENLIICGDFNLCHQAIDIHNPKANAKSPGFLPEERAWFSKFLELGFIDTFRYFNSEPHHYTWWSLRTGARSKNLGWRIDYQIISQTLAPHLKRAILLPDAKHSDHCPSLIELKFDTDLNLKKCFCNL